jgi:hypothetical protein
MLAGMWKLRTIRGKETGNGRCSMCSGKVNCKHMSTSGAKTGKCRNKFENNSGRAIKEYNYNKVQ